MYAIGLFVTQSWACGAPPQRMSKIGSCFVAAFKFPISCWRPTDPTIWPSAEEQPLTRKERARAEMGSARFSNPDMRWHKARVVSVMHTNLFFFLFQVGRMRACDHVLLTNSYLSILFWFCTAVTAARYRLVRWSERRVKREAQLTTLHSKVQKRSRLHLPRITLLVFFSPAWPTERFDAEAFYSHTVRTSVLPSLFHPAPLQLCGPQLLCSHWPLRFEGLRSGSACQCLPQATPVTFNSISR